MSPLAITLIILAVAIILFLSDKISPDLVALLVVVSLGVTGVLTPQETFSGFSRSAVITIISIFILAEGLKRAGVTDQFGSLLLKIGGNSERRLAVVVMIFGAFLSLFMNNIAAAAVLLPAASGAAHRANIKLSRILIPLAYATILGGMATLLTTANVVASSLLRDQNLQGFGLLDFTPLGILIVLAGTLYMAVFGLRLLPQNELKTPVSKTGDLVDIYQLDERLFRVQVPEGSALVGRSVAQCGIREKYGLSIIAVERGHQMHHFPHPQFIIQQADNLLLEGQIDPAAWEILEGIFKPLPKKSWMEKDLESQAIEVFETILAPRSALIGQTLQSANFREKYGMVVLGIWRHGRPIRSGLTTQELQFGDALLMQGPRDRLRVLQGDPDLIVLEKIEEQPPRLTHKKRTAGAIFIATLVFSSFLPAQVGEVMLGGALMMVLAGLLRMEQAYRSIEWKSVFLVAGMLPMGIAITKTGAAVEAADWLIQAAGGLGPYAIFVTLFLATILLGQVMNSAAVVSILIPISIQVCQTAGLEPRSVVMGITLAATMAFITPLGHPVNVLVMAPGGYQFRDYVKVGLPLAVVVAITILALMPIFWPL